MGKELVIKKETKKAKKADLSTATPKTAEKKKESSSKDSASKIVNCTCTHEFQDKLYGKNKRLARRCGKSKTKATGYKCTVCNANHTI